MTYIPCILCLVIAALFMYKEYQKRYVPAVTFKSLASFCFVLFGIQNSTGESRVDTMILIGLILGMIADVLLNLRFVLKNGKPVFLAAILVFLAGHIMYLLAVFPMAPHKIIIIIASVVLTALLMKWIITKITAEKAFKLFGIVYIGAIVMLNCTAAVNAVFLPSAFTRMFAAGAFLFLISDIILILNRFGKESKLAMCVANLALYYIGQLLIAGSLMHL